MDNVIIHIGYHKSASTFLQKSVFTQLPVNYIYMAGVEREILDMAQSRDSFDPEKLTKWLANEIKKKYGGKENSITVLSHEELSGHPHGYHTIDPLLVAQNLKKAFPDAKILIIIRNQFAYLSSIYTFRVSSKGHEYRNFTKFLNEEGKLGLFDHLEYDKLVKHYMDLFGKEKVLILPMEGLKKSSPNFINSLCNFIEVPYQLFETNSYVNKSTKNPATLSIWRFINYFFAIFLRILMFCSGTEEKVYYFRRLRYSYYYFKQWSLPILDFVFRGQKYIDIKCLAEYNELLDKYSKTNARLEKLTNLPLKDYGYPTHNGKCL